MDTSESRKPKKSILKTPSNFEETHTDGNSGLKMTWDEENIIETFHPENKTYGHRKIDEPKTPYNYMSDSEDKCNSVEDCHSKVDPEELAKKLQEKNLENELSEEEMEKRSKDSEVRRRSFEKQRKLHYNEFLAAKMAHYDDDEDEDEEVKVNKTDEGAAVITKKGGDDVDMV